MNLDRSNYEQWALDYLEGTLGAAERESFERFLSAHADLAAEIRSLDPLPVLPVERIAYPAARALLRGGRRMALRRAGSLLSGAAAASLFVGLFVVADRTVSQGRERLMSQRIVLPAEEMPPVEIAGASSEEEPQQASPAVLTAHRVAVPVSSGRIAPVENRRALLSVVEASETSLRSAAEMPVAPVLDESLAGRIEIKTAGRSAVPVVSAMSVPPKAFETVSENGRRPLRATRSVARTADEEQGRTGVGEGRTAISSLLAPLDCIIPIKTYRTENESGIEIASLIRIGNRKID